MGQLILVVEDEKPIADIVKYNLEKEGYEVEMAFDGREALDKAFRLQPDLVLLDIMLPSSTVLKFASICGVRCICPS